MEIKQPQKANFIATWIGYSYLGWIIVGGIAAIGLILLNLLPKNEFVTALVGIYKLIAVVIVFVVTPWFAKRAAQIRSEQNVYMWQAFRSAWIEVKALLALFPYIGKFFGGEESQVAEVRSFEEETKY